MKKILLIAFVITVIAPLQAQTIVRVEVDEWTNEALPEAKYLFDSDREVRLEWPEPAQPDKEEIRLGIPCQPDDELIIVNPAVDGTYPVAGATSNSTGNYVAIANLITVTLTNNSGASGRKISLSSGNHMAILPVAAEKEIRFVEYFDLLGRKVPHSYSEQAILIQKTTYTDGSSSSTKFHPARYFNQEAESKHVN